MKHSMFAQIPTSMICRFGELTKREIIVVAFLFASRNRRSGLCNPSRKTISEATGIALPNLSNAVRGLVEKGWIIDHGRDGFEIVETVHEPDEKGEENYQIDNPEIINSITSAEPENYQNDNSAVIKSITKVTDLITENYQIDNALIKDSEHKVEHKINRERESRSRSADFGPPIGPTLKANHPALVAVRSLTGHQPDRATWDGIIDVLGEDPDLGFLSKCYTDWVMRGFRKQNYGWITDWYANGKRKRTNANSKSDGSGGRSRGGKSLADIGIRD